MVPETIHEINEASRTAWWRERDEKIFIIRKLKDFKTFCYTYSTSR